MAPPAPPPGAAQCAEATAPAKRASPPAPGTARSSTDSGATWNIEQRFEADFASHLEKASQKRQIGSSSSLLLPGLAAALATGAAGGYQWARRKGKQEAQRPGPGGAGERPTLRRLKFLVKWGHWQLLELGEEGTSELRTAVLDEVVGAFSPWVQRIYLLSAHRGWSAGDCTAEVREVSQHLAPLCQLLQRRAAAKAVEEATEAVGLAALMGALDAKHVARCRVVFPTILETVCFFDRFPASFGYTPIFDRGAVARRGASPTADDPKADRLRTGAEAIREVLERPDIVQAVANWNGQSQTVIGLLGVPPGSKRGPIEVPPEGAEDEDEESKSEGGGEEQEMEYYSCSGESDNEAAAAPSRPAGLPSAAPDRGGASSFESFEERSASLARGDGDHSWRPFEESTYDIRSESYLRDRKKVPAGPSLLELVHFDFFRIGPSGPVLRAARHEDMLPAHFRRRGDNRFLFIQNWIFAPYQALIIGALAPDAPWLAGPEETPQARSWRRFLEMPLEEQRSAFKVIMSVEEGPWLVKRAVPKKPVLIGKQLKMQTFHAPGDHFELVIDVSSGRAEQVATGLVMRALRGIQLAMATLIEGATEDELPEALLLCASMKNVNISRLSSPVESSGA